MTAEPPDRAVESVQRHTFGPIAGLVSDVGLSASDLLDPWEAQFFTSNLQGHLFTPLSELFEQEELTNAVRALCVEDLRNSQLLRAVFALMSRMISPNLRTQNY